MVDEGGFEREVARRVDGVAIVRRGLHRRLVHGQQVELRVVALVEEQLVTYNITIILSSFYPYKPVRWPYNSKQNSPLSLLLRGLFCFEY